MQSCGGEPSLERTTWTLSTPSRPSSSLVRRATQRSAVSATSGRRSGISSRSEEHTSELQSLMRISYAVFCLKKKKQVSAQKKIQHTNQLNYMNTRQHYKYK